MTKLRKKKYLSMEKDLGTSPDTGSGTSDPAVNRKNSKRAADDLFGYFEDMIADGRLQPGDRLPPERDIVDKHQVSRTVVREAILALSAKGLVEARPRFRPVVRPPTYASAIESMDTVVRRMLRAPGGVRNLFDSRVFVETGLVRAAARNATDADFDAMKVALARNKAAINDNEQFFVSDVAFHRIFYQIADNPVMIATQQAYVAWLLPHWRKMPGTAARNRINYESHEAIFDAVKHGDPDRAETAMQKHMADAWDQVRDTFEDV